jgi:hypothetical protein
MLSKCRLCGADAKLTVVPGDTSMHSGRATAECTRTCANIITLTPRDMGNGGIVGMSSYESDRVYLDRAKDEVVRRWNLFNSGARVTTSTPSGPAAGDFSKEKCAVLRCPAPVAAKLQVAEYDFAYMCSPHARFALKSDVSPAERKLMVDSEVRG